MHDDGPGVPRAAMERIFEPFWRSDEVRTDARGFGLGLAIVRHVALRHGGRIDVGVSPSLGGARFRLVIPTAARR